jgi:hypothetical protein
MYSFAFCLYFYVLQVILPIKTFNMSRAIKPTKAKQALQYSETDFTLYKRALTHCKTTSIHQVQNNAWAIRDFVPRKSHHTTSSVGMASTFQLVTQVNLKVRRHMSNYMFKFHCTLCNVYVPLRTITHFSFVRLPPMQFKDAEEPESFLACSCGLNPLHKYIAEGCYNPGRDTKEEVCEMLQEHCIHIRALKELEFTENNCPETCAVMDECVTVLYDSQQDGLHLLVDCKRQSTHLHANCEHMLPNKAFIGVGLVGEKRLCYTCNTCGGGVTDCEHVETLTTWLQNTNMWEEQPFNKYMHSAAVTEQEARTERPMPKQICQPKAKSQRRIKMYTNNEHVLKRNSPDGGPWLRTKGKCIPSVHGTCKCGCKWNDGDPEANNWIVTENGTLYGLRQVLNNVTVYYRPCTNAACEERKAYDGEDDGVFNYSDHTLFLEEVMLDFVCFTVCNTVTFYGYHKAFEMRMPFEEMPLPEYKLCSETTLRQALEAFIEVLDVDFQDSCDCPICSKLPLSKRTFVMDCKVMGFARHLQDHSFVPDAPQKPPHYIQSLSDLFLIKRKKKQNGKRSRDGDEPSGSNVEKISRLRQFAQRVQGCVGTQALKKTAKQLFDGLDWFVTEGQQCKEEYSGFLDTILSEYPVPCFIAWELVKDDKLGAIIEAETLSLSQWQLLDQLWKPVATLLRATEGAKGIPSPLKPLFRELNELAKKVQYEEHPPSDASVHFNENDNPRAVYARELQVCRPSLRPPEHDVHTIPFKEFSAFCNKHEYKVYSKTPGIFLIFCPHGVCVGFEALNRFEGPMMVFDVLYRRFKVAPGMVNYDNACNLSRTCYKLAGSHFRNTFFFIERYHSPFHISCGIAYTIDAMLPPDRKLIDTGDPGETLLVKDVNSQVAEQTNSRLEKIARQTGYMSQHTYMAFLKVFMYFNNKDVVKKMKK